MSPISVIITIAAYFVILFTISYIAGRKADNAAFTCVCTDRCATPAMLICWAWK